MSLQYSSKQRPHTRIRRIYLFFDNIDITQSQCNFYIETVKFKFFKEYYFVNIKADEGKARYSGLHCTYLAFYFITDVRQRRGRGGGDEEGWRVYCERKRVKISGNNGRCELCGLQCLLNDLQNVRPLKYSLWLKLKVSVPGRYDSLPNNTRLQDVIQLSLWK